MKASVRGMEKRKKSSIEGGEEGEKEKGRGRAVLFISIYYLCDISEIKAKLKLSFMKVCIFFIHSTSQID